MKRMTIVLTAFVFSLSFLLAGFTQQAEAGFNRNNIMSDSEFDEKYSMNAASIDAFLNSFPNSCISPNRGFRATVPSGYSPSGGFTFGGNGTAGSVIATAAQAYDINPKVLLVTLQKEQSLVNGNAGCTPRRYVSAMGYGCLDGGTEYSYSGLNLYTLGGTTVTSIGSTCVNSASKAGFSQQIIRAAWLLKFSQQRSRGNVGWAIIRGSWDNSDDPQSCYGLRMTKGTHQICPGGPSTYYDGLYTIDGTTTLMETGATAAFYNFTPHFHGNQNFVGIYESWFGSTQGYCYNESNVSGAATGREITEYRYAKSQKQNLVLTMRNNTGSKCVEAHIWNRDNRTWAAHLPTNLETINPTNNTIISAQTIGDNRDELLYVKYKTGAGKVEIHTWDNSLHQWAGQKATILHNIDPTGEEATSGEIISGDLDGNGYDEIMYVKYSGQSGKVEVHTFNSAYDGWAGHNATVLHSIHPFSGSAAGKVMAADINADGKDEMLYVKYNGSSGKVEVHTFSRDLKSWAGHATTVLHGINPLSGGTAGDIIAGDIIGDPREELMYVKYNGSSGKSEVHTMSRDWQQWDRHTTTNLTGYAAPF